MNLNKVFILGRVTADPQLRSTTGGSQVSSFSIATNRVWNDKSGSKKEEVEFHNVVASRFLTKGALVLVEGRLQTRDWEGKDGQKRKTTEIICERLQLGPKPAGSRQMKSGGESVGDNSKNNDLPTIDVADEEINSEDLPF
jgi:single-strand DNA-binding protein